ncbi:hypothetical protein EA658_16570 [Pseudoxanthomonas winnipegensis]|uniref:DNA 5'-3' helicase n=1 Tax=Pseudoxanthomonas winnipegensis TaxID=2480810 RepID=A0ABY1WCH8_9GAMM|nr:DnaB-like helicase C-terminal domain-containing protein [Pseudoxanthomonas winnipegensis]TAA11277.1 hypothetical protein EA659_07985 [Pseudoxanthomonas winnipegensis]TAA18700.1 hypothetical protein EA658_16570 [Pseudoxanthomonas winnipegensis]TAH73924.1 hypothetical protein EA657_00175 [Pseudoxanthomonas winnipegensis]
MKRDDSVFHVERLVLHTAMNRPSALAEMAVLPKHFGNEVHAQLWDMIQQQSMVNRPIDPVTMADAAARLGHRVIAETAMGVGTDRELYVLSEAGHHARIIVEAWRDRETLAIGLDLANAARQREEGAADRAMQRIMDLHVDDRTYEHTARTAMQAALGEAAKARANGGRLLGVPTGIFDLDDTLGGLHDGDLIVIGAPPGAGKTGLLLGATSSGARVGPVGLVSGEQPADQVGLRWLATGSQVAVGRLRAGKFGQDDMHRMDEAAEQFGALPVHILDRGSPDITEVIRVARRWRAQFGIRALYVDYLQRLEMEALAKAPKHERIGAIARSLKNLARDLRIPVVALAQVRRPQADKAGDNPRLSMHHLADSSEIEKEADQIMMLWRDRTDPNAERSLAEINVVKNRHGNIGTVYCTWHGGTTSFLNRSAADEFGEAA